MEEIDALKEMEKAKKEVKEREDRKAITTGAGAEAAAAPRMNINVCFFFVQTMVVFITDALFQASKMSGIARSRHQLSTLLREAYENREALEEKIAEGRRNRKEAGNKYGMYLCAIIICTSLHLDFRFLIIQTCSSCGPLSKHIYQARHSHHAIFIDTPQLSDGFAGPDSVDGQIPVNEERIRSTVFERLYPDLGVVKDNCFQEH